MMNFHHLKTSREQNQKPQSERQVLQPMHAQIINKELTCTIRENTHESLQSKAGGRLEQILHRAGHPCVQQRCAGMSSGLSGRWKIKPHRGSTSDPPARTKEENLTVACRDCREINGCSYVLGRNVNWYYWYKQQQQQNKATKLL